MEGSKVDTQNLIIVFFHVSGDIFIVLGQQPNSDKVRRYVFGCFVWLFGFWSIAGEMYLGNYVYVSLKVKI